MHAAPLVLNEADVRQSLSMADAIAAIEAACHEQAAGDVVYADRVNLRLPNGWMRLMPAGLLASGVIGYKEFHLLRSVEAPEQLAEVRYAFHLIDAVTGRLLAMLDANYLTATRTGAAAGVATKYLALPEASRVGIIGSGAEASTQIDAVAAVRPVEQVKVYSRSPERRERFAREVGRRLGVASVAVDTPRAAIADADILVVATNTAGTGVALQGSWLHRSLHVNSIGSTLPTQREIDPAVWAFADRIVLDTRRLLDESGDALAAREAGALDERKIAELQDVVTQRAPGRASDGETTLYKSVGTAVQDVAVAFRAYQQARERGLGREVPDYQSVKQVEPN
ncbi:MAG TPA: ornithine cyclodeaminase family protein [Chloroflexota bacterium]|jgi:ornithine cyclodeaminase/alanine dehydrogenase